MAEAKSKERAKLGARSKDDMREKLEGARAEAKIRVNDERTRVSTKTEAKTEALDISKSRSDAKAKEITG